MPRTLIGTVKALWRYPVKSMLGESVPELELTDRGFWGDRAYALWDEQHQRVASAKNPKKWARLLNFQASLVAESSPKTGPSTVEITLPDGRRTSSLSPALNELLSNALGRPVQLISSAREGASIEHYWPEVAGTTYQDTVTHIVMPEGTFFDACHVHAISTATLAQLAALSPTNNFDARRFRPNIVIQPAEGSAGGFIDEGWVNQTLQIGEAAQLRVFTGCPRCVMTTLPQSELPADLGILRTTAKHNRVIAGIRATALRPGRIRCNDPIWVESA
ncbi:MOSC domain-containing protein [Nodosilinea nodulosa]|uniref:MOSC domain-containing protein n=1 Tax=Nodosilinea nodulosa TaxID=416001 RepID=UPI000592EC26|nr:MOSC N-terminal beta barrel domain-containing protein [Nodosilinea nodulosa]